MYEQQIQEDLLFLMVYAGVAVMSLNACCYLLLRRGNAFAADITPPLRLRRWTAAFFAAMTLSHVWYLPTFFLSSSDDVLLCNLVGGLLDTMTLIPLVIVILLVMLQDRRRPLWPVVLMVAPLIAGMVWGVISHTDALLPMMRIYVLLLGIGSIIYMVRAVRQYGRWLRDNYADLEHKEVWQSFLVLAIMLLVFGIYAMGSAGLTYQYVVQINDVVLVCYLLWRVETLSDLNLSQSAQPMEEEEEPATTEIPDDSSLAQANYDYIGVLLQEHCADTQLYLQHDLSLTQLAKSIGTNRFYLSQYFSSQGTTYNTYINDLRVNHFVRRYRDAVDAQQSISALQLAQESGFRSYTTFSSAFKRKTGQSVRVWMKALE
jgi:AraC-like DNA-binding protein